LSLHLPKPKCGDPRNDQNEKLGDISEILLDKSGKVDRVVIGLAASLA
jgi:hypothetical protein